MRNQNRNTKGTVNVNDKAGLIAAANKLGIKTVGTGHNGKQAQGKGGHGRTGHRQQRRIRRQQQNAGGGMGTGSIADGPTTNVINFFNTKPGQQAVTVVKAMINAGQRDDIATVLKSMLVGTDIPVDAVMKSLPGIISGKLTIPTFGQLNGNTDTQSKVLTVPQFLSVLTASIALDTKVSPVIGGITDGGKRLDLVAKYVAACFTRTDKNDIMGAATFFSNTLNISTKIGIQAKVVKELNLVRTTNVTETMDVCTAGIFAHGVLIKATPDVLSFFGIRDVEDIMAKAVAIPGNVDALRTYAAVPGNFRPQLNQLLKQKIDGSGGVTVTDADIKTCLKSVPGYNDYQSIILGTTQNGNGKGDGVNTRQSQPARA